MQKMYKLMSVMLCVTIMSMVGVTVNASTPQVAADRSDNVVTYNNFDNGQTYGFSRSDTTNITVTDEAGRRGKGVYFNLPTVALDKFDLRTNAAGNPALEVGTYYYFSVWAKANAVTKATSQLRPVSGLTFKWKPAVLGTEWTNYQNIGKASADTVTFRFCMVENGVTEAYPFCLDDYAIIPIKLLSEVENVATSGTLILSAPEELELTTSNVVITDGVNEIAPSQVVIDRSGVDSVWNIAYEELEGNTDYSLIIKSDITDEANYPTYAFKTKEKKVVITPVSQDIFALNGFDGSFETVETGAFEGELKQNAANNLSARVAESSEIAYDGSKYLTMTDCKYNTGAGLLFPRFMKGVSAGKKYVVSFYAKAETSGYRQAKIFVDCQSGNNIFAKPILTLGNVEINNTEWKRITAIVEPVLNPSAASNAVNLGIHVALQTNGGVVYIDNLQMHELKSLSFDSGVMASVSDDGKGVNIDLLSTEGEKTVYCLGVKYAGNRAETIKFSKVAAGSAIDTAFLDGATEDYTLFIWDGNLASLCNPFTIVAE